MTPTILDIPQDVLEIIFLHLYPRSFLNFCFISQQFWTDQYRNPTYWRVSASRTFRIPISPLLHAEGERWYWLYKKLRTQTRAFAWGQGSNGELGLPALTRSHGSAQLPVVDTRLNRSLVRHGNLPRRQPVNHADTSDDEVPLTNRRNISWPSKMEIPEEVGVIADLQCGGWSTTLLSSQGHLYSVGLLCPDEDVSSGTSFDKLTRLDYRSRVPIKSFSAGRRDVIGLDEEGYVWLWDRIDAPAWLICNKTPMKASNIVGGWRVSSAYTKEGIVYWRVPNRIAGEGRDQGTTPLGSHSLDAADHEGTSSADAGIFVETTVIPGTNIRSQQLQSGIVHRLGQILNYIVLEVYIVFITDLAKVFACRIVEDSDPSELSFEVPGFSAPNRQLKDIQGSFRNFAIFTATGEVLSGNQDYLDRLYRWRTTSPEHDHYVVGLEEAAIDEPRPRNIPALQHRGVISIAYGDYHFHALHSDGQITSYGVEPRCCGALGLGETSGGARFRGVMFGGGNIWNRDAKLLPIGYRQGREIWFSRSQEAWLKRLEDLIQTPEPYPQHRAVLEVLNEQEDKQEAYSEWVEREGRAWEEGIENQDGLRSYFAISVAAAGWHSAALVLENTEMVAKIEEKWSDQEGEYTWEGHGFPRIILPGGFEFPGSGDLHEWRGGMPSVEELGLAEQDASTA